MDRGSELRAERAAVKKDLAGLDSRVTLLEQGSSAAAENRETVQKTEKPGRTSRSEPTANTSVQQRSEPTTVTVGGYAMDTPRSQIVSHLEQVISRLGPDLRRRFGCFLPVVSRLQRKSGHGDR